MGVTKSLLFCVSYFFAGVSLLTWVSIFFRDASLLFCVFVRTTGASLLFWVSIFFRDASLLFYVSFFFSGEYSFSILVNGGSSFSMIFTGVSYFSIILGCSSGDGINFICFISSIQFTPDDLREWDEDECDVNFLRF